MKAFTCIAELKEHMMRESEWLMGGTVHENYLYFYHDALTQLTAVETREWIMNKKRGGKTIYERWRKLQLRESVKYKNS